MSSSFIAIGGYGYKDSELTAHAGPLLLLLLLFIGVEVEVEVSVSLLIAVIALDSMKC